MSHHALERQLELIQTMNNGEEEFVHKTRQERHFCPPEENSSGPAVISLNNDSSLVWECTMCFQCLICNRSTR